ncbi:MAG TPA: C25 family cysteine peptidase [bacterium]|nr:C25 family cysteine peptidase [bacterium]
MANPGEPLLPVYGLQVLLPEGESVVHVTAQAATEEEIRLDAPLELAREELPTDSPEPARSAVPRAAFDTTQSFPAVRAKHVYTGTYRGYNVAFIDLYPVVYNASAGLVTCARRLEVTIETAASTEMLERSLGTLRPAKAGDAAAVASLVGDDGAAQSYAGRAPRMRLGATSSLVDPAATYPYVIITNSALEPFFEVLRQEKANRGLAAKLVLVSDIAATYSGADLQTKIRNFIKDAYLNWETEYVLLGGDDDIIPHRGLYAVGPSAIDEDIASDLYYAGLDGTWNDDGDSKWGEPGEADLIPEVSVGRAAVGDSAEATNFIAKVIKYENAPVVDQIKSAELVGEALSSGTWGGDYKDEIKYGSSAWGYTTAGFPASFTVGTLYDRDLYPDAWDKEDLIPLLNSGRHLVNHLGHADVLYCMRMYDTDVETRFTNDGVSSTYFILYSQGCYAGSFDNRNPTGYTTDCIGEHFTFIPNGAVAFIGNTRYGWYMPYSTNGSSHHYDRQFFDALFGEHITAIGKANDDSKVDNIPFIDVAAMRWVYYDLVLLGDPAMDIWTDTPGTLAVSHPDVIYSADNQVEIDVTDGAEAVAGARVAFFTDSTYACGYTDSAGKVYLDPKSAGASSVRLAVTAHNFYAHLDTIAVEPSGRPVVIISQFAIDDDATGASHGNSNGALDAGETIESTVSLKNVGQDSALSVSAVLRTSDPYVTVIDSSGAFGDIAPESTVVPPWSFTYQVSPAAPDSHTVTFELAIASTDTSLVRRYSTAIKAPAFAIAGISREDTLGGNGDGCVEAGETIRTAILLKNLGSGTASGVSVRATEADPYVELDADSAYADSVASGETVALSPAFVLRLSPDCPEFDKIELVLNVTTASGTVATDTAAIYVGGLLSDDMESGAPGWVHSGFNDLRIDQWHLDTYRDHTTGSGQSWKFGGRGAATYANFGHGALETPELCLGANARLSFWHWIHAELYSGRYAWDGGIVEISTDGGDTWSEIAPVGGYYYRIYPNFFSPFAANTPCFAWTSSWTKVEFDLSAYQGRAKIRFRFGSDQYYNDEGWYVDDVAISDDAASVTIPDKNLKVVPTKFALGAIDPNPVSFRFSVSFDVPRSSQVAIEIFDVTGRQVVQVANSVFAPGRYSKAFDCHASLAPGVYFLTMRAGNFGETKKLVIVR